MRVQMLRAGVNVAEAALECSVAQCNAAAGAVGEVADLSDRRGDVN